MKPSASPGLDIAAPTTRRGGDRNQVVTATEVRQSARQDPGGESKRRPARPARSIQKRADQHQRRNRLIPSRDLDRMTCPEGEPPEGDAVMSDCGLAAGEGKG